VAVEREREKRRRPAHIEFVLVNAEGMRIASISATTRDAERLEGWLTALRSEKRGTHEAQRAKTLQHKIYPALTEAWKIRVEDQRVTVDPEGQAVLRRILEPKEFDGTSALGLLRSRVVQAAR
jgi:hypothetical protein